MVEKQDCLSCNAKPKLVLVWTSAAVSSFARGIFSQKEKFTLDFPVTWYQHLKYKWLVPNKKAKKNTRDRANTGWNEAKKSRVGRSKVPTSQKSILYIHLKYGLYENKTFSITSQSAKILKLSIKLEISSDYLISQSVCPCKSRGEVREKVWKRNPLSTH